MTPDTLNGGGTAGGDSSGSESGTVRVLIVDADTSAAGKVRAVLDGMPGIRVVEVVSAARAMGDAIGKLSADAVVANLDSETDGVLAAVAAAAKVHPACKFLAISSRNDANLILRAVRSGSAEFVRWPDESDRLAEALGALRRRPAGAGAGQVITVLGSAGGVGCTTLAVNLAVELAEKCGQDVALVDLDFLFGHIAMLLDLEIQYSVADLCGENKTIDERQVQKAAMKHKSGVHVIARPREFEETENLTAAGCIPLLGLLRRMYPYVVVDGPSRNDPTGIEVLNMADWNLVVVQPLVTAARNAKRILQELKRLNFDLGGLQVVCNRAGGGLSHLNIQRLEKSLGQKIVASIPDDWASVSAAINLGEPLAMNAPKSKAREAIRELADVIRGAGDRAGARAGGLFSRLFGSGKAPATEDAGD